MHLFSQIKNMQNHYAVDIKLVYQIISVWHFLQESDLCAQCDARPPFIPVIIFLAVFNRLAYSQSHLNRELYRYVSNWNPIYWPRLRNTEPFKIDNYLPVNVVPT